MEFKVGKWYKTSAGSYVKYSHTENRIFCSSEDIMYDCRKLKKALGKFGSASDLNNFREASLEEIQQYLPEGHEDKIKRSIFDGLIEGNYYRYQYKDTILFSIGRCLKADTGLLKESMCPKNKYFKWLPGEPSKCKSVHPATQEEIEHLDACIAAGKYVDKPEKWIPKVDEWAVIHQLKGGDVGTIGHVFKIKSISDSTRAYATDETTAPGECWLPCNIRKALPHEIPKQEEIKYSCDKPEIKIVMPRSFCEPIKKMPEPDEPVLISRVKKSNKIIVL